MVAWWLRSSLPLRGHCSEDVWVAVSGLLWSRSALGHGKVGEAPISCARPRPPFGAASSPPKPLVWLQLWEGQGLLLHFWSHLRPFRVFNSAL